MEDNHPEVYRIADELYRKQPDWVTFFREVLGIKGAIRRAFPEPEALGAFEQTPEYAEIRHMLAKLRDRRGLVPAPTEPNRVITVRLPQSLHDLVRAEARDRHTSMNKLCISRLLQMVDDQLVPADA